MAPGRRGTTVISAQRSLLIPQHSMVRSIFRSAGPAIITWSSEGTWHDGSWDPNRGIEPLAFTFSFTGTSFSDFPHDLCDEIPIGTAVYVFNIAAKLTLTDVNFTLDGNQIGRYTQFYNMTDGFAYDVPILSMNNVPYGDHTLRVDAFGPNQTLVLFDYAIYT